MADPMEGWDGEFVVRHVDRPSGATIRIAVHRSSPEAAVGGTRCKAYADPDDALRDALRLAGGMTLKLAALGLPRGGGKAVIDLPRPLPEPERRGLLLRYGALLESLRGVFQTGPDLGTSPADMDVIASRTRYVHGATPEHGGAGDPGPYTALGVHAGIRACLRHRFGSDGIRGRSFLIQGLGGVGGPVAARLAADGGAVRFTDADPAVRARGEAAGYDWVEPEDALATECDVLAPCAVGGVLGPETIPALRCAIVAGSANNVLVSEADAGLLRERGILYAPDFIINGGGAIFLLGAESLEWGEERIRLQIHAIGERLAAIFEEADSRGVTTLEAALDAARACRRDLLAR